MGAPAPDLLDRCIAGQIAAWGELSLHYRPVAVAFLRRMGVQPRDAEDACQEVFMQIVRYLHRFECRADFRTWLYKLCLSQAARIRRRSRLTLPLQWLGLQAPVTHQDWSQSRAVDLVERALGAMGAQHRAAFVLFELEGLPSAEVAETLGMPEPTARRKIQEARAQFETFVRAEPFGARS